MFLSNEQLMERLTSPKKCYFDPERRRKILALRKKGMRMREIGEIYDISRQRVFQILIYPRKRRRDRIRKK